MTTFADPLRLFNRLEQLAKVRRATPLIRLHETGEHHTVDGERDENLNLRVQYYDVGDVDTEADYMEADNGAA